MVEENKKTKRFWGTYYDPTLIFRLSTIAKSLAWVVVSIYLLDFLMALAVMILQLVRGYWAGLGFTDYASNFLMILERPLRGAVYFVVLIGIAEVLKVFVDIEENTRRAARNN